MTLEMNEESNVQRDMSLDVTEVMKKAGRLQSTPTESEESTKELSHGSTVTLDDGTTGIVVDFDSELKSLTDSTILKPIQELAYGDIPLYERMNGEVPKGTIDYGKMVLEQQPESEHAQEIFNVKKAFSGYAASIRGVSRVDSEDVKKFEEAKELLRSGKVKLPTVEEYHQQQEELKRMKEEQLMAEQQNTLQQAEQAPQQQASQPQTINLALMEEQYKSSQQNQIQQPQQSQQLEQSPMSSQHINPEHVTTFKVPEGRTTEFVQTLTAEEQQKVEQSKVIKVEEERMVKVPTATRKITSLDEFKRISQSKVTSEAVEVPLLNSGYVAVVRGCGSLEMASILPNMDDMEWEDYAKLYNFCFRRLVSTSIGTLSFNEFQRRTSPYDMPALVHAILRASQPDENAITLTCGSDNCGKDYDIKYSLNELIDWDSVSAEQMARIDELTKVRHLLEDAKRIQSESPVMTEQYVDVGNNEIVVIKSPNGPMIVERTNDELMSKISETTNPFIAIFLMNIKSIFIDIPDEHGDVQTYEITDLYSIATELQTFSDTQLEILKDAMSKIKTYDQFTYSFKGMNNEPIVCPHCGFVNKRVPCKVQQLVFHRVTKAMS